MAGEVTDLSGRMYYDWFVNLTCCLTYFYIFMFVPID